MQWVNPIVKAIAILACCLAGVMAQAADLADKKPPAGGDGNVTVTFDDMPTGQAPDGFLTALTGGGGPVAWVVKDDASAPSGKKVLAQTSADATGYRFPMCICKGLKAADVDVSVKFKAVAGKEDQAAGLVLRWKDKDNYYVARANALESNVRFYKVEAGQRHQLAGKGAVTLEAGKWYDLKLSARGSHFQVLLGGQLLFEADDKTFAKPGLTGMWTKADSVTHFDDFAAVSHDRR